jgi:DUF4097 and DUF4098 domain-containing protein YvlB
MKIMLRAMLSGFAAVACVTATAQAQRNYGQTLDTTVALDRQATVDVSLMSGRVDVIGTGGSQAHVKATTERGDIEFDAGPGRIRLSVDMRYGGRSDATFELAVPAGTRVIVNSVSAGITIRGVKGEVDVESVSGSIAINDAARRVKAESVSGNVDIGQVVGDVRGSSVSGRVEVDDVSGDLETESVSGRISMTKVRSKFVRAESVSGRIAYAGTFEPAGSYEFKTHSGSLNLSLPADVGAQVRIETFSGAVDSDFPVTLQPTSDRRGRSGTIEFKIGDGRSRIVAESFSGNIKIGRGDGQSSKDEPQ